MHLRTHQLLLERFRSLQLRARDGELTETDYAFMKEHMSLEGRETQFAGPDTYRLVTTQALLSAVAAGRRDAE